LLGCQANEQTICQNKPKTFFYALVKPLLGHHESSVVEYTKIFFFPQIENYAARKKVTKTEIERMLASNLSYEISL
jgi:hypothetical protein